MIKEQAHLILICNCTEQHSAGADGQRAREQGERSPVGGASGRLRQRVGRGQARAQREPQHQAGAAPGQTGAHQQVPFALFSLIIAKLNLIATKLRNCRTSSVHVKQRCACARIRDCCIIKN